MREAVSPEEVAGRLVGYANRKRYENRARFLFDGIDLTGARVLDVGCGSGAWAIWAALRGAAEVLGIEPEFDGSTADSLGRFRHIIDRLDLKEKVRATNQSLQELEPEQAFDVVVMFNVINHLDEDAVETLDRDPAAFQRYVGTLSRLRAHVRDGGWVVVADCARTNLWNQLGLESPFARDIDWSKHQNPAVWARVFQSSGFRVVDLRWSPLQPFLRLTSNWPVHYITCSHFVLRLQAQ
jgi:cyclopropane fatty-acyl-phospholipid synthase-like methyltransferase